MIRTVAIYLAAAVYTVGLLWGAAQISPTSSFDEDVVRIIEERSP